MMRLMYYKGTILLTTYIETIQDMVCHPHTVTLPQNQLHAFSKAE